MSQCKTVVLFLMLCMASAARAEPAPIDNTVPPCDDLETTALPPCDLDAESVIVPPPLPGSDESIVEPPPVIENGVQEGPDPVPPPAPVIPAPDSPDPELSGPIPPPMPKPHP